MQQTSHVPDLQSIITPDLYGGEQKPKTADIKQILDTLKDRVQPLSPVQMQIISYLEHLQSREIHKKSKNKVYQSLIDRIVDDAHKVAPPQSSEQPDAHALPAELRSRAPAGVHRCDQGSHA